MSGPDARLGVQVLLGGGQQWFMGKEKLAAGPDVPAFPLFLQPPARRSLFSFPDGQEESNGGNCHCLITVQGPLYGGRNSREQGSFRSIQDGRKRAARAAPAPGFHWLWYKHSLRAQDGEGGHCQPLPSALFTCLCTNPQI